MERKISSDRRCSWTWRNDRIKLILLRYIPIGLKIFLSRYSAKEPYPEFSAAVIKGCAQKGLMIEGAGTYGNVIRFLAPLVMTDEQLEAGLDIYESVIKELLEK